MPVDVFLVGTAGSLSASRDTSTLYAAFLQLHKEMPQTRLVLAGPVHGNPPPDHPAIIYLGELPHNEIPKFLSSLDLAVICMRDDKFGRYAFPQKAYEMLACGVPTIAARVGALESLFEGDDRFLYEPGDAEKLKMQMILHFSFLNKFNKFGEIPAWCDQAEKFDNQLLNNILQ